MKNTTAFIIFIALLLIYKESDAQKYYATSSNGDVSNTGTIVEYDAATGTLSRKVTLNQQPGNLAYPYGDLTYANYKFYGVASVGGDFTKGAVFEYDPFTNSFAVKASFDGTNGESPRGTMTYYSVNGNLYGLTYSGGTNNQGVIFEFNPYTNTLTKKIDLANATGSRQWYGKMTQFINFMYGMTYEGGAFNKGVIFQYDPLNNIYTKKYDFGSIFQDGGFPTNSLSMYNGKFYGLTRQGGGGAPGVIFEWDPSTNTYTKKNQMTDSTGKYPYGSLTVVNDKMYGMNSEGPGTNTLGSVFEWVPATNVLTKRHTFDGSNARFPLGTLLYDGNMLYGMTTMGGPGQSGSVFEFNPVTNVYTYKAPMSPHGKEPTGAFVRLPYVPEVDIKGNNLSISDGDNSPVVFDYTDFGNSSIETGMVRSFTIKNTSMDTALYITNVIISGSGASSFSVQSFNNYINKNDSGYLYVRFSPSGAGAKTATVTLSCDDPDENTYDFAITANATGNADRGLVFDGNDQISFGSNAQWNFSTGTVEFWVKPNYPTSAFRYLMANSDAFMRWSIYMAADRQSVKFYNGSAAASWSYNFTQSKWYHLAFVQNGNSMQCYINGAPMGVQSIGPSSTSGRPFFIGNLNGSGFGLIGAMDEIRFWNTQRTQQEINDNMTADVSQQAGLFAYYRLDQGEVNGNNASVNFAYDYSGNCYKGTLNNFSLTGSASNWTTGAALNVNTSLGIQLVNVQGNGITIPDGSLAPQTIDNTDFGTTTSTGTIQKVFTIQNVGTGSLSVTGITMSGTNPGQFSAGSVSPNPVPGGQSANVTINFSPGSNGLKTATVNVASNDCDNPSYSFAVQGNGISPERGLSFDGSNDRVTRLGNGSIFDLSNTASWEMWFKAPFTNFGYDQVLIASRTLTTIRWSLHLKQGGTGLTFLNGSSSGNWNYTFNPSQWYHLAFVQNGGTTEAFVNGVSIGTQNIGQSGNTGQPFNIGFIGSSTQYFRGSIDEIRIWNVARSASQIQANMNTDLAMPQSGLVVYYKCDQGVAGGNNTGITELLDHSGNCIHAPMFNFALNGSSSNFVDGGVQGINNSIVSEMDVRGNGVSIGDGDNSPDVADGTNFGNVLNGSQLVRTFKIHNTGPGNLDITGAAMLGPDAGFFTMGAITPGSPVLPNDSASFTITFSPTSSGTKNATLTLINNDCNEGSYDFAISGAGYLFSEFSITIIPEGFYSTTNEQLNIRDSATVYLHSNAPPYTAIDSAVQLIDSITFTGTFSFYNALSGTYYIRVEHRNALETWSKNGGESFTAGNLMNYNFTDTLARAYGNNMKQIDFSPVRFAIFSGDINDDDAIDLTDIVTIFNDANAFLAGYNVTDLTGDNFVDLSDLTIAFNNSNEFVTVMRP